MHGTVDNIFILKMLIDKYVKSKPQKHDNFLFSSFVDFRKAFDCIPSTKLEWNYTCPYTQMINMQLKLRTK